MGAVVWARSPPPGNWGPVPGLLMGRQARAGEGGVATAWAVRRHKPNAKMGPKCPANSLWAGNWGLLSNQRFGAGEAHDQTVLQPAWGLGHAWERLITTQVGRNSIMQAPPVLSCLG